MIDLAALGWSARRQSEFDALDVKSLVPGRVCLEHNHVYRVLTASGEVLAEVAGRIKHLATGRRELPAVGDWVALRVGSAGARASIKAILKRDSWFSRKAAGRVTAEQVLAANVDVVLLVFALGAPVNRRAIERYLVVAGKSGARPVVVLNKADLAPDPAGASADASAVTGGAPVHAVSAATEGGVTALESYLAPGVTLALLGPSGAGKSSIVNRLLGESRLPTGEVREWDRRGRHTSVHRQMVVRPAGGLIVDTPGLRELQLWESDDGLAGTFADIDARADRCRFRDCQHDREPGCAVKAAVKSGEIPPERHASYLKLRREQADIASRRDERALTEEKRQAKIQHRALKAPQKSRGR